MHDYICIIIVSIQHCFSLLFVTDPFLSHSLPVDIENNIKRWPSAFYIWDVVSDTAMWNPIGLPRMQTGGISCQAGRKGGIYSFSGTKHTQFHEEGWS